MIRGLKNLIFSPALLRKMFVKHPLLYPTLQTKEVQTLIKTSFCLTRKIISTFLRKKNYFSVILHVQLLACSFNARTSWDFSRALWQPIRKPSSQAIESIVINCHRQQSLKDHPPMGDRTFPLFYWFVFTLEWLTQQPKLVFRGIAPRFSFMNVTLIKVIDDIFSNLKSKYL